MSPGIQEPAELWERAQRTGEDYLELLKANGHIVPVEPCAECGETFRHRHDPLEPDRRIRTDIFGHDVR